MESMNAYANESSIHGIRYILGSDQKVYSRIVWIIALIFSICGFSYYIYEASVKFMVEPEIVLKSNDRNAKDFPAPAVTICSNLFAKGNVSNLHMTLKKYVAFNGKLNLTKQTCEFLAANLHWCQPKSAEYYMRLICPNHTFDHLNVLELIDKSALITSEAFFMCAGGRCDKVISRVFTNFGICFTQNSLSFSEIFNTNNINDDFKYYKRMVNDTLEENYQWSPEKGFWPVNNTYPLRAERDLSFSYMPILSANEKDNLCALKNYRVFFHKPNEIVTPYHESIYVNFEEYTEFRIVIKSHQTDKALRSFSPEVRKCYFEGERQLKFFKSYTKAHCKWECKANKTLEKCGCAKFSMPRDAKTPICNLTKLNCAEDIIPDQCNCLTQCIDIRYTYQLDKTHYIPDQYGIPPGYVMSWAQVSIENEVVEEIENFVSYKVQNFISDFGGLLGLFMGCSLLSVVEISYFLTNGIMEFIGKFRIKTSPKNWATRTFDETSSSSQMSSVEIIQAINVLTQNMQEIQRNIARMSKQIDEILKRDR